MKARSEHRGSFLLASLLTVAMALFAALPAKSYLTNLTAGGGAVGHDHWDASDIPVVWRLNPATASNISGNRGVAEVVAASFATWTSAPNTALSAARGSDVSQTSAGFDGVNLICFVCSGDFSKEKETLGVTITTVSNAVGQDDGRGGRSKFVGQILDADTLFNPNRSFSTGGGAAQDLQTIATHEIGHFFGLAHSGIVRAMMFPFAPDFEQTLSYDDVAGISSLYPKPTQDVTAGVISGTVRLNGSAVFGAHVFAESTSSALSFGGSIRKTPIGAATLPDGSYRIEGVPIGSYTVTAEPFDLPVTNSDIVDLGRAYGRAGVDTNFTTRWH